MTLKRLSMTLFGLSGVVALSFIAVAPVSAAQQPHLNTLESSSSSSTEVVQECVEARRAAAPDSPTTTADCTVTKTLMAGRAEPVPAELSEDVEQRFKGEDASSLAAAIRAGSVESRAYSQSLTGLAWTATQDGIFYFNGDRAWVSDTYLGYTGTHNCAVNYSVGFSVSLQSCGESGDYTTRALNQSYYVQPLNAPIGWSAGSTTHVYANGGVG